MIAAMALNLGSIVFRLTQTASVLVAINAVVLLIVLVVSMVGLVRLTSGLKYPIIGRVLCCLLMFVPLVNLITLGIINHSGTKLLREHGFVVGLLGAKKRVA